MQTYSSRSTMCLISSTDAYLYPVIKVVLFVKSGALRGRAAHPATGEGGAQAPSGAAADGGLSSTDADVCSAEVFHCALPLLVTLALPSTDAAVCPAEVTRWAVLPLFVTLLVCLQPNSAACLVAWIVE